MLYNLFENRDFVSVFAVALLAEGVDRNQYQLNKSTWVDGSPSSRRAWIEIKRPRRKSGRCRVALLAEGVDRNRVTVISTTAASSSPSSRRAWIEISSLKGLMKSNKSPSSRRAWIEIFLHTFRATSRRVALLAEGVDRNRMVLCALVGTKKSPSSRRAWIEMSHLIAPPNSRVVALLAEGVDRNFHRQGHLCLDDRRPPRGGRG